MITRRLCEPPLEYLLLTNMAVLSPIAASSPSQSHHSNNNTEDDRTDVSESSSKVKGIKAINTKTDVVQIELGDSEVAE